MANKGNFNFEKGGKGSSNSSETNGKINLNKEAEELVNGIEVDEYGNPIGPVKTPQPEEPASVLQPDFSESHIEEAIEEGPEQPKKKGVAWLWALIGIAVVLAFLGMVFLNKGDKEQPAPAVEEIEEAAAPSDSIIGEDSASISAPTADAEANAAVPSDGNAPASEIGSQVNAADKASAVEAAPKASETIDVPATSAAVQKEALNTIRGDYGNGAERKNTLGASYNEVQGIVNQMKKAGKF